MHRLDAFEGKLTERWRKFYGNEIDLIKKAWVAKDIIQLNYDSVLLLQNGNNPSSISYRDLTEREINAYRNALYRIKSEESITKSKGR